MHGHFEIWLARVFNDHLPGLGNFILHLLGLHTERRPWANFMVMEILVAFILIVLFAFLRPRLSMDRPGKLQQVFEIIHDFISGEAKDSVGHGGAEYVPFFCTLFVFILCSNLIGIIPVSYTHLERRQKNTPLRPVESQRGALSQKGGNAPKLRSLYRWCVEVASRVPSLKLLQTGVAFRVGFRFP